MLFIAIKTLGYALQLTDTKEDNKTSTQPFASTAEDTIPDTVLETLMKSSNHCIREAAIDIIISRFAKDNSVQAGFEDDCFSFDPYVRAKARYLVAFLFPAGSVRNVSGLDSPPLWGLLDKTLCASPDKDEDKDMDIARMAYHAAKRRRDMGLGDAWTALHQISDHLIERPQTDNTLNHIKIESLSTKQVIHWCRAMSLLLRFGHAAQRNASYAEAIRHLYDRKNAGDLEQADLTSYTNRLDSQEVSPLMVPLESVLESSNRVSPEEIELRRRRRREVMVLHEGDGVFDREDLISPLQSPTGGAHQTIGAM